jgi:hypothetical protein
MRGIAMLRAQFVTLITLNVEEHQPYQDSFFS